MKSCSESGTEKNGYHLLTRFIRINDLREGREHLIVKPSASADRSNRGIARKAIGQPREGGARCATSRLSHGYGVGVRQTEPLSLPTRIIAPPSPSSGGGSSLLSG